MIIVPGIEGNTHPSLPWHYSDCYKFVFYYYLCVFNVRVFNRYKKIHGNYYVLSLVVHSYPFFSFIINFVNYQILVKSSIEESPAEFIKIFFFSFQTNRNRRVLTVKFHTKKSLELWITFELSCPLILDIPCIFPFV